MRAVILSVGLSFSVPLESQAFSYADDRKVIQQLESIQTALAVVASQQAVMSQKLSQLGDNLNQQSEKVSQVDFKLNVLYGGAGVYLLIVNGISGVGKGLDAIDDLTARMQRKEKK